MRISKDPHIRKQEILDTAMRLFYEKGYNATSMADIAKEMEVVKGLCYRYFDSKQALFEEAMNQYVDLCTKDFILILQRNDMTLFDKIEYMGKAMLSEKKELYKYHDFFHKPGNEELHEQLTMRMCKKLYSHILDAVYMMESDEGIKLKDAEILVSFALYGQVGMISNVMKSSTTRSYSSTELLEKLKEYLFILVEKEKQAM